MQKLVLYLPIKTRKKPTLKSRILQENCRNFQCCQNLPAVPRQHKTHIAFLMFPLLFISKYLTRVESSMDHCTALDSCLLGKLSKSSNQIIFENPFITDKSERRSIRNTMHKRYLKFALVVDLAQLKFTYITVVI